MPPSRLPLRAHFHLERETSGYEAGRVTYGAGPLSTTVACEAPDASPAIPQRPLCVVAIFLGIPSGSLCGGERSRTPSHELLIVISNGNRTEWGPIWSVIIRVINKIGRPRSGSPICLSTSMIRD